MLMIYRYKNEYLWILIFTKPLSECRIITSILFIVTASKDITNLAFKVF